MSASRNWAFIHEKMPVREHERARASETEESEAWKLFRCASRARFDLENEKTQVENVVFHEIFSQLIVEIRWIELKNY